MKKGRILAIISLIFLLSIACKTIAGNSGQSEGYITEVTMARNSDPETYGPVDPTTEFSPGETIHAVVEVDGAPSGTLFTVKWLTIDVGDVEKADLLIDTTETEQGGSGFLDFTLEPDGSFLPGTYKVDIYVNGELFKSKSYKVVGNQ